jgi:hypothetical protein
MDAGPATTKKITVANLVATAPQGDLLASNNLNDVASPATARTNLELGTAAVADTGVLNGNVIVADAVGLPAINGSQLTNVSSVVTAASLRGTTNPHIGVYPNQSFLVTDNPSKSVMLASDADGTLNVINSLGKFPIPVGLSVSEDSTEPDIEMTITSGTYSLISGDSDALGINGLPIRQGFNVPDIGAYPAPLLISGGAIT